MKTARPSGLTIIDLVETLNSHGFKSLADLEKIPPNPLQWSKREWSFAAAVIAKGLGISEAEVKRRFRKASDLMRVFNETLRKTGLIIELQEIKKISEGELLKRLKTQPVWDEEWVHE